MDRLTTETQDKLRRASDAIIKTVGREEGYRLIHDDNGNIMSPHEIILLAHELTLDIHPRDHKDGLTQMIEANEQQHQRDMVAIKEYINNLDQ